MPDTPAIPYDLFISYAHRDNVRGQVRELRDAINDNFEGFAGRPLKIFFDEDDIPTMTAWEQRIAKGLDESRQFLAVLSPNFFASDYCRREWEEYTRYEAMRQCLGEGVAPVYFVELPGLETGESEELITEWVHGPRQWCDLASQTPVEIARWHDLGKRALEDTHVADRLRELKGELAERLKRADRAKESPTNIYRHNAQFVGRVRELTQLRHALSEQGSVGVVGHSQRPDAGAVAVHGVGGMGKTELALAYSHAFAWDYPGGRWLAACEHVSDFNLVLRQLAEPLGVEFTEEENKDAHLAGERILKELRERGRSLLLLDNVDDPALLTPDVLMRLPRNVHMLATTRMGPMQLAGSPHDHTFIAVDELPSDDALALIRSHQPECRFTDEDEETAARELVKLLDGFTLAVETAAIYLGRRAGPGVIAAYVVRLNPDELLELSEKAAGDPTVAVRHKEALLERTLKITFETLSVEQMHVLTLGALLPADQIPLPWLRAVEGEGLPSFEIGTQGDAGWSQLCESLLSLRLFQSGDDEHVVRMHRMVQELIRKRSMDQASALDSPLVEYVKSRAEFLWEGWVHLENRWEVTPLAACAWHWMERDDGVGSYLASQANGPLQELARYAEAEPLMERALAIDEASYGQDHSTVATRLSNLAQLFKATNRLAEAEPLMKRALAIEEASYGPDSPHVAIGLNNLALLLQTTNRFAEAEQLMKRALAIDEASYGQDHPKVARDLNNLAQLFQATNRLAEAEPLMKRALAIEEASYGPDHPKVALNLNNLAQLFKATNRLAEAEPLMKRALAIDEASYGQDHPKVAIRLNNLAMLLRATNRLAEAEPLMKQTLAIDEASYGPDHPNVAIGLNNLALLLQTTNRFAEAEQLMKRALAIDESSYGPDHPNVARGLSNLASLFKVTNQFAEAEPLMRRALAIDESSHGTDHPKVGIRLNNLSQLLKATNRLAEAEPLMRRHVVIFLAFTQRTGHQHPHLQPAVGNYAGLLRTMGKSEEEIQEILSDLLGQYGMSLGG
jgi:tetratricopeptide (TPR) repeat protein